MDNVNIHDYLRQLQDVYANHTSSYANLELVKNIFAGLPTVKVLSSDEKLLIHRLYADISSLAVYKNPKLVRYFSIYRQTLPKETIAFPIPKVNKMSNEEILTYFHLEGLMTEEGENTFCQYVQALANPSSSPQPLRFSDLHVRDSFLPRCFLIHPFFACLQISFDRQVDIPRDITFAQLRNTEVYKQVAPHIAPFRSQIQVLENSALTCEIAEFLDTHDLTTMRTAHREIGRTNTEYTYYRESLAILEQHQKLYWLDPNIVFDRRAMPIVNEQADGVHTSNYRFLQDLQRAGTVDASIQLQNLSRMQCQRMVQAIQDESIILSFSGKILPELPAEIQSSWDGDQNSAVDIRSFLHRADVKQSLSQITELRFDRCSLRSIPYEITLFPHLETLVLSNNYIVNIDYISDLLLLTEINLSGNKIVDISSLTSLTHLQILNLANNKIVTVFPLGSLTLLELLDLSGNKIRDVSPLSSLMLLELLCLSSNKISDISFLASLVRVNKLDLSHNRISDISSVSSLTSLEELNLSDNKISAISPLASLIYLQQLNVSDNKISDVSSLISLMALEGLNLSDNKISDVSFLTSLIDLRQLDISHNQVSDVSPIGSLMLLEWLNLGDNNISNIFPLASLRQLEELDLFGNKIVDASPISSLQFLEYIDLSYNKITDINCFSSLTKLDGVYLSNNEIVNIPSVVSLQNLGELDLSNNQIADVSPLASLENLFYLDIRNNNISDVSSLNNLMNKKNNLQFFY